MPIICQHTLGFLFCWETAVSLIAQRTSIYNVNSVSRGARRLKFFVAGDDLGDGEEVLIRGIWIGQFGGGTLDLRLLSPCQPLLLS